MKQCYLYFSDEQLEPRVVDIRQTAPEARYGGSHLSLGTQEAVGIPNQLGLGTDFLSQQQQSWAWRFLLTTPALG